MEENHRTWAELLPKVGCAIRTSVHEATGLTPFFINFGREHKSSGNDYDHPLVEADSVPTSRRAVEEFKNIYDDVRKRLDTAHSKSKVRYNLRRRPVSFAVGESVYVKNHALSDATNHFTAKFAPNFNGPFVIKRKLSPVTYEIEDSSNKSKGTWHVQDIKSHPPDQPSDDEDGHS